MAQAAWEAALADDCLATIVGAACRHVSWYGGTIDDALCAYVGDFGRRWPSLLELVSARLIETGNREWSLYLATGGNTHD